LSGELAVCGLNAVRALAGTHPDQVRRFFLRQDRMPLFPALCKKLSAWKRLYKICEDGELERICQSERHQGVVAMIPRPEAAPLARAELDQWAVRGEAGLVLCSVGNDHNLGAIVRSAAFFGARYIVLAGEDAAPLTTSAYRVAEGGMEHVAVRSVRDAAAFLRDASARIATIGADPHAQAPLRARAGFLAASTGIAIVLGNEETGLPPEVKAACAHLVRVPGTPVIECLNVAQTATLFLHEFCNVLP
jgi:TrmH RNA methyltransferase